jgi:hypothetical protein
MYNYMVFFNIQGYGPYAQPPNCRTILCQLFKIAYSQPIAIYGDLILNMEMKLVVIYLTTLFQHLRLYSVDF